MRKIFTVLGLLVLLLTACTAGKYDREDFLGKTSAEITAEFGDFDCIGNPADADGLYHNTMCGYTVRKPQKGFFGKTEEVLFFIHFDEKGVAHKCSEGYRPGG